MIGDTMTSHLSPNEVPIHTNVSLLKGSYQWLMKEAEETKHRFSVVEDQLQSLMKMLGQHQSLSSSDTDSQFRQPTSSNFGIQVPNYSLEHNWDDSPLGYLSGQVNIASRESVLPKVEMSCCDGSNIHDWLVAAEHFWAFGQWCEEAKMDLVPLFLEGRVKKWFVWVLRRGGFQSWSDFKQQLIVRFVESVAENKKKGGDNDRVYEGINVENGLALVSRFSASATLLEEEDVEILVSTELSVDATMSSSISRFQSTNKSPHGQVQPQDSIANIRIEDNSIMDVGKAPSRRNTSERPCSDTIVAGHKAIYSSTKVIGDNVFAQDDQVISEDGKNFLATLPIIMHT